MLGVCEDETDGTRPQVIDLSERHTRSVRCLSNLNFITYSCISRTSWFGRRRALGVGAFPVPFISSCAFPSASVRPPLHFPCLIVGLTLCLSRSLSPQLLLSFHIHIQLLAARLGSHLAIEMSYSLALLRDIRALQLRLHRQQQPMTSAGATALLYAWNTVCW